MVLSARTGAPPVEIAVIKSRSKITVGETAGNRDVKLPASICGIQDVSETWPRTGSLNRSLNNSFENNTSIIELSATFITVQLLHIESVFSSMESRYH